MEEKTCSKCHKTMDISSFHKRGKGEVGYRSHCKKCNNIKKASRYVRIYPDRPKPLYGSNTKEYHLIYQKEYRASQKGKEALKRYNASQKRKDCLSSYRESNRNTIICKQKEYAESYNGKMAKAKAQKKYCSSDIGKAAKARVNHRRRISSKKLPCTLTHQEWNDIKKQYGYRCVYCNQKKELTRDHILPLGEGGGLTKENVVPACRPCNSKKGNRGSLLQLLVL